MPRAKTRSIESPFSAGIVHARAEAQLSYANRELDRFALIERRLQLEGKDPKQHFERLQALRSEAQKALPQRDLKALFKVEREKRPVPAFGDDDWYIPRPMQQATCRDQVGAAQMDSLRYMGDTDMVFELFNGPEFGILTYAAATRSDLLLTGGTWLAAWEGSYSSQIPPHPCPVQLIVKLRVQSQVTLNSQTDSAPLLFAFAAIFVQPDVQVPPPSLGLIFATEELFDIATGQPLNNGMLRLLGHFDQRAGVVTMERELLLGAAVPAGAQSQVWLLHGIVVAQGAGVVGTSGRMIAYGPGSTMWGGVLSWAQFP